MANRSCYNNAAFTNNYNQYDAVRESLNRRLELGGFQAYNETFVDDNGLGVYDKEEYVDIVEDLNGRPKCRRSVASVPCSSSSSRQVSVGYHRNRYESVSSEERRSPEKSPLRGCYEGVDALYRRFEEIEAANEEYVDNPEDRMGGRQFVNVREPPLGSSSMSRHVELTTPISTPVTTPRKEVSTPKRPLITPKKTPVSRGNSVILAPMIADVQRQQHSLRLHRSRSAIISSPKRPIMTTSRDCECTKSSPRVKLFSQPTYHQPHNYNTQTLGRSFPAIKYHTPLRIQSFNHLFNPEHDQIDLNERMKSPNRKPNTAIITPNMRSSIAPLLPVTPPRHERPQSQPPSPMKSPSIYSKTSWPYLPPIHLPTELLCFVGFLLLLCGAASTILCFYILSLGSRKYFLNFGALAGFVSLVIGLMSCRTNKWKWLPHRNYLTGYILLGAFSLLNALCLAGIVYAFNDQSYALLDVLGGAVCGISVLLMVGSVVGMVTSACCHMPPPDNRVAHSASGFFV